MYNANFCAFIFGSYLLAFFPMVITTTAIAGTLLSQPNFNASIGINTTQIMMIYEKGSCEEKINILLSTINTLKEQGIDIAEFPEIFDSLPTVLSAHNLSITEENFYFIKKLILDPDYNSKIHHQAKSARHPSAPSNPNQPKLSNNCLLGYLEIIGGSLLAIIPLPVVREVGIGLLTTGIATVLMDVTTNPEYRSNSEDLSVEKRVAFRGGKRVIPYDR